MTIPSCPRRRPITPRVLAVGVLLAACTGGVAGPVAGPSPTVATSTDATSPTPTAPPTAAPAPTAPTSASPSPTGEDGTPRRTSVPVRLERRTTDDATAGFEAYTLDVLTDARGWVRAGFDFTADPQAPYVIVLAEGDEVDRLCLPYDTFGQYSCQNGPTVALNADRWRSATPSWTGTLDEYRTMLVNHEVGHLLHLHHPQPQCPGDGFPAPVMMQQSTELGACTANPWPLPWEVELAAERREPLAPPADHDVSDHRPAPPRQRHDAA